MKRITLVLGVVAVMAAMLVTLAAPAMAKDNNRHENRVDNRLDRLEDRLDNRLDLDDGTILVSDVDFSPFLITNEGLADELCSPLSSDAINDAIPGCIFGDSSDVIDNDVDFDTVGFVGDIDDGHFVDVDFDRGVRFADGNAHHDDKNHNGRGGPKGHGK